MKIVVLFLAVMLASVAFADVGPGPAKPDITVRFMKGDEPYVGEVTAMFRCWDTTEESEGIMGETDVKLSCNAGVCNNEQWFYKFNPCFYPETGEIIYEVGGNGYTTGGVVSFPNPNKYEVTLDVDSGEALVNEMDLENGLGCPLPMFALGSLALLAIVRIRH